MPSPKSGKAGSPVTPTDPKEAKEADKANPGEVEKAKAEQRQTKAGKYGSVKTKPFKPGDSAGDKEEKKKKSWIEIELVDEEDKPVPGMAYRITLPDGETVAEGTLDEKGLARVEGIEPGSCKVTFPTLDKDAWEAL
jgi:type VI secretion system secreted protein VgrG